MRVIWHPITQNPMNDSGQLVGQRDGHDVGMLARTDSFDPPSQAIISIARMNDSQHRSGAMDEQHA